MKNRLFILTYLLFGSMVVMYADVNTDRAMSKIGRDNKTYISADCRATTEQEAYDNALSELTSRISSYVKESGMDSPDAVYLPEVSSIYQRLDSRISDDRYRVFLYVKKSDLRPLGTASNSMVLTKSDVEDYEVLDIRKPESEPIVVRDTITQVEVVEVPMHSVLSALCEIKNADSFKSSLTELRKGNKISAAAAFPISNIDDYYVAVLNGGEVKGILHVVDGKLFDVLSGKEMDPHAFRSCTAFWFTLKNN